MAHQPRENVRPVMSVRELEIDEGMEAIVAENHGTPLPAHAGLKRPSSPTDFAPPAVREAQPRTIEELRQAGKLMAEAMSKQYLSAAEAILQTGREYQATQRKLAITLIEEARWLEENGDAVFKEYEQAAAEYRQRAQQLSADIELAANKSDKAIGLCHDMIAILAATERAK